LPLVLPDRSSHALELTVALINYRLDLRNKCPGDFPAVQVVPAVAHAR